MRADPDLHPSSLFPKSGARHYTAQCGDQEGHTTGLGYEKQEKKSLDFSRGSYSPG